MTTLYLDRVIALYESKLLFDSSLRCFARLASQTHITVAKCDSKHEIMGLLLVFYMLDQPIDFKERLTADCSKVAGSRDEMRGR